MLSNEQSWHDAKEKASHENGWFIPEFIDLAVRNIAENFLRQNVLEKWVATYQLSGGEKDNPKLMGIVMAGNIPLVSEDLRETAVHYGGPVQIDRGFVLHRPLGNWQSTLAIDDEVGLTTSKDVLEAVARGEGPKDVLVSLGYAGWSAGQLEQEIAQNAWLTVAADPGVLFETPVEARLPAAMRLLGIDFSRLSDDVGHA